MRDFFGPLEGTPFGQGGRCSGAGFPYAFAGMEYDGNQLNAGTGIYHTLARYYSPILGRFVSEDSLGFRGGNVLFGYVSNNPASNTDPLGKFFCGANGAPVAFFSLASRSKANTILYRLHA